MPQFDFFTYFLQFFTISFSICFFYLFYLKYFLQHSSQIHKLREKIKLFTNFEKNLIIQKNLRLVSLYDFIRRF